MTANFGFESVSSEEKKERVFSLFQRVAPYYDLMNDLMSLGLHRCWKRRFFKKVRPSFQATILDVAGGTGDIARGLQKTYPYLDLDLHVLDLSWSMMEKGREKSLNQGFLHTPHWIGGNAESLPLGEKSVDLYTIVFGLRNVAKIGEALQEAWRVLKPGGRFFCLEFSPVQTPLIEETILKKVYDFYLFEVLPRLGESVAQDAAAYRYLAESIRRFPSPDSLAQLLEERGFHQVKWSPWSSGIVVLHQAVKGL